MILYWLSLLGLNTARMLYIACCSWERNQDLFFPYYFLLQKLCSQPQKGSWSALLWTHCLSRTHWTHGLISWIFTHPSTFHSINLRIAHLGAMDAGWKMPLIMNNSHEYSFGYQPTPYAVFHWVVLPAFPWDITMDQMDNIIWGHWWSITVWLCLVTVWCLSTPKAQCLDDVALALHIEEISLVWSVALIQALINVALGDKTCAPPQKTLVCSEEVWLGSYCWTLSWDKA